MTNYVDELSEIVCKGIKCSNCTYNGTCIKSELLKLLVDNNVRKVKDDSTKNQ